MIFAAIIEYSNNANEVKALHSVHRQYLRSFLENGQLRAAGPFAEEAGALWVLDAETLEEASDIVKGDPYVEAGVIVSWQIRPLSYWSAQEAKGSR